MTRVRAGCYRSVGLSSEQICTWIIRRVGTRRQTKTVQLNSWTVLPAFIHQLPGKTFCSLYHPEVFQDYTRTNCSRLQESCPSSIKPFRRILRQLRWIPVRDLARSFIWTARSVWIEGRIEGHISCVTGIAVQKCLESISFPSSIVNQMAWLSIGDTNDDLCDKLVGHGVLRLGAILNAFRVTDRGDFVQQDCRLAVSLFIKDITLYHNLFMTAHLTRPTCQEDHSWCKSLHKQIGRSLAYADRPFKHEHVHISAPHMYATVLEQLELCDGLSFLNIGTIMQWCDARSFPQELEEIPMKSCFPACLVISSPLSKCSLK